MEKTYKVSELLETKYLFLTPLNDLQYLLSNCIKSLESKEKFHAMSKLQEQYIDDTIRNHELPTLDLADMKLTAAASNFITTYQLDGHVKFIDSKDEGRQAVLQKNVEYRDSNHPNTIPLPTLEVTTKLSDYVNSLSELEIYKLQKQEPMAPLLAAVTLIMDAKPQIKFDLSDIYGVTLLKWIHTKLDMEECQNFSTFYAITNYTGEYIIDTVSFNYLDKTVETRQKLHMNYQRAWEMMYLVPTVIGEGNFSEKYPREMKSLTDSISTTLRNFYNNAPKDFYEVLQPLLIPIDV